MSKVCEVCSNDSGSDVLWSCVGGCNRKFHASCVGVSVSNPRGSLRITKKDKKTVDPSAFLLPCCDLCQTLVTAQFEFNALREQQNQLTKQIDEHSAVIHRVARQLEQPNTVSEVIEGIEVLLTQVKQELASISKNNSVTGVLSTVKNHLTQLVDVAISEFKNDFMESLTAIKTDVCQINGICQETATSILIQNNPMFGFDIIEEIKSLSSCIEELKTQSASTVVPSQLASPKSPPSLNAELNEKSAHNAGWRLLGPRRIWRADWTDYDNREKRRLEQQKKAKAARNRRNQRKKAYNNNLNINYNNRNKNKNRSNSNANNSNQTNLRKNNNSNNKTHKYNRGNNNNNNYNNSNINNNNYNHNRLPSDRELLAAAKDQFSRPPPVPCHRPIHFQRGEVLNPYPACAASCSSTHTISTRPLNMMTPGTSSAVPYQYQQACRSSSKSCEACACKHSCFA